MQTVYIVEEWDSRGDGQATNEWVFSTAEEAKAFVEWMEATATSASLQYYIEPHGVWTSAKDALTEVTLSERYSCEPWKRRSTDERSGS